MKWRSRPHEHRWKVVGHERQDGPGKYVAGTFYFSTHDATFYLVRACDCGEVIWTNYYQTMAQIAGRRVA